MTTCQKWILLKHPRRQHGQIALQSTKAMSPLSKRLIQLVTFEKTETTTSGLDIFVHHYIGRHVRHAAITCGKPLGCPISATWQRQGLVSYCGTAPKLPCRRGVHISNGFKLEACHDKNIVALGFPTSSKVCKCSVSKASNALDPRLTWISLHYALVAYPMVHMMRCPKTSDGLLELCDLSRFSMIFLQLCAWLALITFCCQAQMHCVGDSALVALGVMGAGLHFHPGGYVGTRQTMSEGACTMHRCFLFLCYIGFATTCVLQGIVVGDGIAVFLCAGVQVIPAASTLSFGNLFRNAVSGV